MQLTNPISATENCRYCLMCRHVCPVGHVTKLETLTPHGWALTIASVRRDLLTWNDETVGALYHCADCGACRSHCVTDQPLPDAIASARAEVTARGLAPATVYKLAETLKTWGNPYGQQIPTASGGQAEIALFVGDDAHFGRPATLNAALALLKAVGVEPLLIGVGRNNGYLASSLGFPDLARSLAQPTLDELVASGARRLLVLTAGDFYVLRQLYDDRLGLSLPDGIVVEEVTVFLAGQMQAGKLSLKQVSEPIAYAYVDPTHAVRVNDRHDAPRKLLAAVMGGGDRELFWSKDRTHPSGATALQYSMPHLAMMLAGARLEDARNAGAEAVISDSPGDLALLGRMASRYRLRVQCLYELLAAQLNESVITNREN